MGPGIALRRARALMILLVGMVGCGQPEPVTVRISVEGTREGEPLEPKYGGVDLGRNTMVHTALIRVSTITVRSDDEEKTGGGPINVDLFDRTVVVEVDLVGSELVRLVVAVERPQGDGVRRGEPWSVIVGGLMDEVPFEYRDDAMPPLEIGVSTELDDELTALVLRFELKDWFRAVDADELVEDGGRYLLDADHNAAAAAAVEAAIRASLIADDDPACRTCENSG
ncbi:MAG: hypothetical protein V3T05_07455 [Myxococcota bacterium]